MKTTNKHPRPPVVVVLGHVDHGKTTLLDSIRKTNTAKKEVGAITQSIGAYEATTKIKGYAINKITFIDTPGHEIFTKLRFRGTSVADIALLVVDGVDSVMPQTIESILHIKNAKIPFVVVINKMDLPSFRIEKVKKDLINHGVLLEGMGGEIPSVAVSAKTGRGIEELLETILLMASIRELKYTATNPVKAYVIESKKNRQGIIASVIIKDGSFKPGELIYYSSSSVKIKALIDEWGDNLKVVYPSKPFLLLGFKELPQVGLELTNVKTINQKFVGPKLEKQLIDIKGLLLAEEEKNKLKIIIKTESFGSLEAILSNVSKNKEIEVISTGIGEINKSDVFLAKTTKAVIICFGLLVDKNIIDLAKQEKVVIKTYSLIYQLFEELVEVSDLLTQTKKIAKQIKGEAKILATFILEGEKIAGVKIIKGKINLNDQIELYREEKMIGKSKIVSLRTKAKSIAEAKKNSEAGMMFFPKLDFSIGDMIKSYSI